MESAHGAELLLRADLCGHGVGGGGSRGVEGPRGHGREVLGHVSSGKPVGGTVLNSRAPVNQPEADAQGSGPAGDFIPRKRLLRWCKDNRHRARGCGRGRGRQRVKGRLQPHTGLCGGLGPPWALLPPPLSSAPGTALPGASPSSSSAHLGTGHGAGPGPLALQWRWLTLGARLGLVWSLGRVLLTWGLVVLVFTEENRKQSICSPGGSRDALRAEGPQAGQAGRGRRGLGGGAPRLPWVPVAVVLRGSLCCDPTPCPRPWGPSGLGSVRGRGVSPTGQRWYWGSRPVWGGGWGWGGQKNG